MAYETIVYEKKGPVVTLTLNRPDTINAINPQMTAELHGALDEADADAEVRAIILTGAGRGFSAGFDIATPRRPLVARRHRGRSRGVHQAVVGARPRFGDRAAAPLASHEAGHRRGARLGDGRRLLVRARL